MKNNIPLKSRNPKNIRFIYDSFNVVGDKEDTEKYVRDKLESLGIKVKRSFQKKGVPDFVCRYGRYKFYVEVKGSGGLSADQARWIMQNPNKLVYVYYVHQDVKEDYTGLL